VRFVPLASGSSGNATLVEFGRTRILIDAGLSARALGTRLAAVGVAPEAIDCIVLSHEHEDHARGAQRFSMRHRVPLAASIETLEALDRSPSHFARWLPLVPATVLDLGGVKIEPFPVPHDAARPVGFVLHGEGLRVGIATDLGHATTLVVERLRGCHLVMVETNHDDSMLRAGSYPWHLKQRVLGRLGHLSNHEGAALLRQAVGDDCRAVVLAHLSEQNNRPALARQVCATQLAAAGRARLSMRVAQAHGPTPPLYL
jgi:phosphoribosyl 1,2-cyclic phosphodiesterase